jgi:hypothetical protein
MYYFEEIINRLKTKLGFTTDKELYDLMDIKQGTFTNWRSRNKIPYEEITTICVNKKFNLNYILGGEFEEKVELINYKEEIINNLELLNENQIKYVYHITEAEKIKGKNQ